MRYRLLLAALTLCATGTVTAPPRAAEEPDSMRFHWMREGPDANCAPNCREWVAASGRITMDSRRDFERFTKSRDIRGATMVLDSVGGSVTASLEMGRMIRGLGLRTAVGRTSVLPDSAGDRARWSPRGECASMCVFMLLGGVQRTVPAEARIMVHQIWPGSKRSDANAESYTAEEIVRVQRDLGRIARYTVEMGGDIALFEMAMRVPPWEHLRSLSQSELRRLRLVTDETATPPAVGEAVTEPPLRVRPTMRQGNVADPAPAAVGTVLAEPLRPAVSRQGWLLEGTQATHLTRRHVLTVDGDEIGQFELSLTCGREGLLTLAYSDARASVGVGNDRLAGVTLRSGRIHVALAVKASALDTSAGELRSQAIGTVSPEFFDALRRDPASAIVIGTRTAGNKRTATRVGGAGFAKAFEPFATSCGVKKLSQVH